MNKSQVKLFNTLFLIVTSVFLLTTCSFNEITQETNPIVNNNFEAILVKQITAAPLTEMLPKLDTIDREHLENFMASVPDPLFNDLAYPQFTFVQATMSKADGTHILQLMDGMIELEGVVANPGSVHEQTNVVCLLNNRQISCSPDADVWAIELPPKSLAFVPYKFEAEPGDMLTLLYIANQEPLRLYPASIMQWFFVEHDPPLPENFVEASAHEKIEEGCDFTTITQSDNLKYIMPGTQNRETALSLVFQTCDPVKDELIQLIPIVDRSRVVSLPGEVWHKPLRLANPATVIPLDIEALGNVQEFQVAIVPVGTITKALPSWWGWFPFTQAVHLED